ncbi:MAG: hypothetical protein V7L04_24010 [Nostoc sp.]|uniref:hypothetical protein n=1 Tax=Nostoc sp. TaxID=1180 RepID=UPI002FFB6F38
MEEFANKLAAQSSAFQRAYLGSLAPSLVKSGNLDKYYKTLTDFDFITAKINHPEFGVQPLIEDYDLIDHREMSNHSEYNFKKGTSLELIQGALRLSAHILVAGKRQLASQLHGRLLNQKMPEEIQALLAQIKQRTTTPWLYALTPSLTPPGGRLLRTLNGHSDSVKAVAVTPNGQQVISASDDKTLKVWNLATGEEQFTLNGHNSYVKAVAVTPNGQQVISASYDNTLKVWNLATGEEQFTLNGHSDSVNAVAVTPNGQQVISALRDTTLKVWNLATGEEQFTLNGHSNSILGLAVTPNGQQVISASWDTTLKVWNLATGEVIATFTGDRSIYCCAVAPDGMTIVAGDDSGRVHFLRFQGIREE